MEQMLEIALKEAGECRASLCRRCESEDELIAVATALAFEAARIYREMGGRKLAAAQFYGMADREAAG